TMIDWADGHETCNYAIKREAGLRHLAELVWVLLSLLLAATIFVFHSWQRSQIVNIGYEAGRLNALEQTLRRSEASLILEEETLKNPERIDLIARGVLGMTPVRPSQILATRADLEPPQTAARVVFVSKPDIGPPRAIGARAGAN